MQYAVVKLLTIITESALESKLLRDIENLGANGYTVTNARGKGSRGVRSGAWDANSNVRIEVLCQQEVADAISTHLHEHYYESYAMVVFTSDVDVTRPGKF